MQPIKSLLVIAATLAPLSLAPAVADAQPGGYYSQPQPSTVLPGGFHNRQGRLMFGFSLGLGTMKDSQGKIGCDASCNYSTLSGMASGHIGGFIGPRLALMAELQGNIVTLATDGYDDINLVQSALMGAVQYWVTPQLWLKGGIGFANLSVDDTYDASSTNIDNGMALMGGIGFELLSSQRFSVDLQGRILAGSYDGIDEQITAGSIGVGINWF
ncbi:MAG: hypothetical protein H0T89_18340 [Deltaproteobacteria bacterium]|nr:hypothetical protein [Deltaproteobacteria bacterium]MDQ3298788.1 hypothetical protein [Myxococcota bacterium]